MFSTGLCYDLLPMHVAATNAHLLAPTTSHLTIQFCKGARNDYLKLWYAHAEKLDECIDRVSVPTLPWRVESVEDVWNTRKETYTHYEKAQAWDKAAKKVEEVSEEMVRRWSGEIDTLLVFAGLFSAVITAFNVESYKLLRDAVPDPTLIMLARMYAHMSGSTGYESLPTPTKPIPRWIIFLNSLWFSGLVFSLAAASIGITVKQWLGRYQVGLSGVSKDVRRLRQYRLNGLRKWHLGAIVATLPILLQIALDMFVLGLLVLLWNLSQTVAIVVGVFISLLLLFIIITPSLPVIWTDCSYVSPQSIAIFALYARAVIPFRWLSATVILPCLESAFEWFNDIALLWFRKAFSVCNSAEPSPARGPVADASPLLARLRKGRASLERPIELTWRDRIGDAVRSSRDILDSDTLGRAFHASLNSDYIELAGICLFDLENGALEAYCRSLKTCITKHHPIARMEKVEWIDLLCVIPQFWSSFLLPMMKIWATEGCCELLGQDTSALSFSDPPVDRPNSLSYFPPRSGDEAADKRLTERVTKLFVAVLVSATRTGSRDSDLTRWVLRAFTDTSPFRILRDDKISQTRENIDLAACCDLYKSFAEHEKYLSVLNGLLALTSWCERQPERVEASTLQGAYTCLEHAFTHFAHFLRREPSRLAAFAPRVERGLPNATSLRAIVREAASRRDPRFVPAEMLNAIESQVLDYLAGINGADWNEASLNKEEYLREMKTCVERIRERAALAAQEGELDDEEPEDDAASTSPEPTTPDDYGSKPEG
ncbi:hypothetical protein GY45DRAFT_1363874 [Cubamyces sp. BRFM 1775]|nr:hypothetical protein GY45DRAFT_1363874 [Cubamyces sp. BRFM 1775]